MNSIENEEAYEIPLMLIREHVDSIDEEISRKINEIEGVDSTMESQLEQLLYCYKGVFNEKPSRIRGYEHYFQVNDRTPYLQKGWPVPIKYQEAVQAKIRRMLEYGIIERAQSPYINLLVTVIKRDGRVRLCLDAQK